MDGFFDLIWGYAIVFILSLNCFYLCFLIKFESIGFFVLIIGIFLSLSGICLFPNYLICFIDALFSYFTYLHFRNVYLDSLDPDDFYIEYKETGVRVLMIIIAFIFGYLCFIFSPLFIKTSVYVLMFFKFFKINFSKINFKKFKKH
uniref:Uncharacterized protein n=1 Tax=Cyanoptyche gloeocystis TaxID=77922 RepID=A0A3G1IWH6_9EUKA|nr:hypothetical protein [Cyanoptyche gloeocystis]